MILLHLPNLIRNCDTFIYRWNELVGKQDLSAESGVTMSIDFSGNKSQTEER